MSPPKLSVIIPTYNRAGHLKAAVDSLAAAGVGDYEAIVVDDGSTDETADVVRSFGPEVRYLRQENAGPAVARNTGFGASRGKYVAFLDSDDRWIPGAARRLIAILDRHERLGLVFGDAMMGNPEDGFVSFVATFGGERFAGLPGVEVERGVRRLERRPFFELMARRNAVFLGSLILRREVVEASGGFDPGLFGTEDWEFFLRLGLGHEYAYCEGLPAALYVQHPGGISHDHDRMERAFAMALRHLSRKPGLDAMDRRSVRLELARQEFGYAYQAYDRGDVTAARERFAACLRSRPGLKNLGYWLATFLPPDVLQATRGLKRGVLGQSAP